MSGRSLRDGAPVGSGKWGQKKTHTLVCQSCGLQFSGMGNKFAKRRYCSDTCKGKAPWRARPSEVECLRCGTSFTNPPRAKRAYCSALCVAQHISTLNTQRAKRHTCLYCRCEFKNADTHGSGMFCSRKCWFSHTNEQSIRRYSAARLRVLLFEWVCPVCGVATRAKGRRCQPCKAASIEAQRVASLRRQPRPCVVCGKAFHPSYGNAKICGDECQRVRRKANVKAAPSRKKHKRADRIRRKAKLRGVTVERVIPEDVFQRDGWRCQLCGCSTPKRLRGSYDRRAPELDHIVPIAMGGSHSYDNTQCACRHCNATKGARLMGQLRLPVGAGGVDESACA